MMMSGCCDYVATTTLLFLLFLIVLICFVESKNLMVKKRFTRDDICKETIKTGKIVQYCPEDVESRRIRTRERMCEDMHDSCSKDSLVYHCLRSRNKLIEVCAPRNFITGNCCVQFNEGLGCIVEDYSVACTECPFHYYSNESITYFADPSCFQLIKTMAVPGSTIQSTVEENICRETLNTANFVRVCPTDEKSLRERMQILNCEAVHDRCSTDKLTYHCVPSDKEMIEVCAPRKYLTGRYCVIFDDGVGRVMENFKVMCPECPFHYYSNESVQYLTCLEFIQSLSAKQTTMMSTEKLTPDFITIPKSSQIAKNKLDHKKSENRTEFIPNNPSSLVGGVINYTNSMLTTETNIVVEESIDVGVIIGSILCIVLILFSVLSIIVWKRRISRDYREIIPRNVQY